MIVAPLRKIFGPAGRGSVLIIALLLLGSASVRLITSASSAMAQESELPTTTPPAEERIQPTAVGGSGSLPNETNNPITKMKDHGELSALIAALAEREARVAKREQQLEMRMRALSIADAEIESRIATLTATEQSLRSTLSLADEASEQDILRLTSVYESMKVKEAAALFEQMEPNFAAGFLGRMRPDAAAAVLAGLSPQVAYSISVILAGRNANVPKT